MTRRLLCTLFVLAGACIAPPFDSVLMNVKCDPAHACPSGQACVDAGCVVVRPLCTEGSKRSCGSDIGVCIAGEQTCADGGWLACAGDTPPSSEMCDGRDNDCDDRVDDEVVGGACELDAGLCAGKTRACVDGGFEQVCGAASYGAEFQVIETKCGGGVDEDCDGRVDISRVVPVQAAGVSHDGLQWAAVGADFVALYRRTVAGGRHVAYCRSLTRDAERQLSDADAGEVSGVAIVATAPDRAVAAWAERTADGGSRVLAEALDGDAVLVWGPVTLGEAAGRVPAPRLALNDAGTVLCIWEDPGTRGISGATFTASTGSASPAVELAPVSAFDDGGLVSATPIDVVSFRGDFMVGWGAALDAGYVVWLRQLSPSLAALGEDATGSDAQPAALRVATTDVGISRTWVVKAGALSALTHAPRSGSSGRVAVVDATTEPLHSIDVRTDARGTYVVWSQGTSPRLRGMRIEGFDAGTIHDLSAADADQLEPALMPFSGDVGRFGLGWTVPATPSPIGIELLCWPD